MVTTRLWLTNSPTSKPSLFAPYEAVFTVCWLGPAVRSCARMMPKSFYGRRRVAGLGERLRTWTGIEDDPLQFTATGAMWVARFECDARQR